MRANDVPLFVLVSGVNGVGKTTLSYELTWRLGIRQHVGLGTIVKTLREFGFPPEATEMARAMDNGLCLEESVGELDRHAALICRVVNRLVHAYYTQGVHCVVEGVQLLPAHLQLPAEVIHLHLRIGDPDAFARQMGRANHRKYGPVDRNTVNHLLKLDDVLMQAMRAAPGVIVLERQPTIRETVANVVHAICVRYTRGGNGL